MMTHDVLSWVHLPYQTGVRILGRGEVLSAYGRIVNFMFIGWSKPYKVTASSCISVSVVTRLQAGKRVRFPAGAGFFLVIASRQDLDPTQLHIQWVPQAFSRGWNGRIVKLLSPLSSVAVKETWSYTFTPPVHVHDVVLNYQWIRLHGMVLT
jgi:hypothetical protein